MCLCRINATYNLVTINFNIKIYIYYTPEYFHLIIRKKKCLKLMNNVFGYFIILKNFFKNFFLSKWSEHNMMTNNIKLTLANVAN